MIATPEVNFTDVNQWIEFLNKLSVRYPKFISAFERKHPEIRNNKFKVCCMLLCESRSKEIAAKLELQPNTVDQIRSKLWREFNLNSSEKLIPYLKELT